MIDFNYSKEFLSLYELYVQKLGLRKLGARDFRFRTRPVQGIIYMYRSPYPYPTSGIGVRESVPVPVPDRVRVQSFVPVPEYPKYPIYPKILKIQKNIDEIRVARGRGPGRGRAGIPRHFPK